jgi:hypothetical protein
MVFPLCSEDPRTPMWSPAWGRRWGSCELGATFTPARGGSLNTRLFVETRTAKQQSTQISKQLGFRGWEVCVSVSSQVGVWAAGADQVQSTGRGPEVNPWRRLQRDPQGCFYFPPKPGTCLGYFLPATRDPGLWQSQTFTPP